jgi:hypothetical protein
MKRIAEMPLRRFWHAALAATLCAVAFSQPGLAQVPSASVLRIDVGNIVYYAQDAADVAKFATDPNVAPNTLPQKSFQPFIIIADIQAVNGQPVMGLQMRTGTLVLLRTAPTAGQAIADTLRNQGLDITFEILKTDGTPIGTITASGFSGGTSPPGSPAKATASNLTVTGGTGAFLGARGQVSSEDPPPGVSVQRFASITEDPSNRRRHGGGTQRWVIHLIPMVRPEIMTLPSGGPAISHSSDFSPVNASKPAAPGEILSVFVTGLGPVIPGVDPGQPFPASPLATVNSPVELTVNGAAAEVLGAAGYPGAVDGYQVNFRLPAGTARGSASIQISAAWIAGEPVSIPVQ